MPASIKYSRKWTGRPIARATGLDKNSRRRQIDESSGIGALGMQRTPGDNHGNLLQAQLGHETRFDETGGHTCQHEHIQTGPLRDSREGARCHSCHGQGIKVDDIDLWGNEADIFRPTVDLTGDEVDRVDSIANEIKNSAVYGIGRAVFKSTFSTHTAGAGLQKRLDKYRERLKNHQGVVKHVYCSELVILCYQLAWENDRHRLFIDLDGKHTWPSTLRRHLKNTIHWQHLGEFAPH